MKKEMWAKEDILRTWRKENCPILDAWIKQDKFTQDTLIKVLCDFCTHQMENISKENLDTPSGLIAEEFLASTAKHINDVNDPVLGREILDNLSLILLGINPNVLREEYQKYAQFCSETNQKMLMT